MNKTNITYRTLQVHLGDKSFSVGLPKKFVKSLGLQKGDAVKVLQEVDKIVIAKA